VNVALQVFDGEQDCGFRSSPARHGALAFLVRTGRGYVHVASASGCQSKVIDSDPARKAAKAVDVRANERKGGFESARSTAEHVSDGWEGWRAMGGGCGCEGFLLALRAAAVKSAVDVRHHDH